MRYADQIRKYLEAVSRGEIVIPPGKTHLLDLFMILTANLEPIGRVENLHYSANALVGNIKLADGLTYEVVLRSYPKPRSEE